MSSGLFALLDDVAAIAKVAAASLDDVAAQAVKTSTKAAGIVIDDTAVTPRYVVGFTADRELPIIGRIAWGSLKNKILYLLPGGLVLTELAPWSITPLLMAGGAYLCFEGFEKAAEMFAGHAQGPASPASPQPSAEQEPEALERAKVTGAIRTDMILSAEIMAISLGEVGQLALLWRAAVLSVVALVVTAAVYGLVAVIVKADDVGLHLARTARSRIMRSIGRGLVTAMPGVLNSLSIIGTVAMLWVGGGILLHGLEAFGAGLLPRTVHDLAVTGASVAGPLSPAVGWLIEALLAATIGGALGAVVAKAIHLVPKSYTA